MYVYDMKKRSMQEPTFLILTALAAGPQHGYGIITDAERISGGVTRLQTGTLYMALDRLRSARLVEPVKEGTPHDVRRMVCARPEVSS